MIYYQSSKRKLSPDFSEFLFHTASEVKDEGISLEKTYEGN